MGGIYDSRYRLSIRISRNMEIQTNTSAEDAGGVPVGISILDQTKSSWPEQRPENHASKSKRIDPGQYHKCGIGYSNPVAKGEIIG